MLNAEDIDLIFLELTKFEEVLVNFIPKQTVVEDYYVNYLNNYLIIGKSVNIGETIVSFLSMRHIDTLFFETPRTMYSDLNKFSMNIIPSTNYVMEDVHHHEFYDKGEFFNMNITGEIQGIPYETYEVFMNITNRLINRKYISEQTKNIQIGLNNLC